MPADEGEGRRPQVRARTRRQGREGTRRGRRLRCRRPGDPRTPLEKEGRACARWGAEAHCPQGAGRVPGPARPCCPGCGPAPPTPGAGSRRGRAVDLAVTLSVSAGQPGQRVASRGGGQLRGGPAGLGWHVTSD
uniref:Uncharacterized protein n=1 Tax=Prolemur simus TaxID=1328070 RepID=A0A8C9DE26_PROSS